MRILFLIVLALLNFNLTAATPDINAIDVTWKGVFGYSDAEPATPFCLWTIGAYKSVNVQSITSEWLAKHPNARVIPVGRMYHANEPDKRFTFVWVVDGDDNLNLELVRQGCFPALALILSENALLIPKADFAAFFKKAIVAGTYAIEHKLGIYGQMQASPDQNQN